MLFLDSRGFPLEVDGWQVDEAIGEAIREGIAAGVFRRAERLNIKSRKLWATIAQEHTDRAATLLDQAMNRLGA